MLSSTKYKRTTAALIAAAFVLLIVAMIQLANPTGILAEMAHANRTATAMAGRRRATVKPATTDAPSALETAQASAAPATGIPPATEQPVPSAGAAPTAPPPTPAASIEPAHKPDPGNQTAIVIPTQDTAAYPAPRTAQPAPPDNSYPAPATAEPAPAPDQPASATPTAAQASAATALAPTNTPGASIQAAAKAAGEPLLGTSCSSESETSSIALDWVLNWGHVVSARATAIYPDGRQEIVDVAPGWSAGGVISVSFRIRWDDGTTASAMASCAAGSPPTATPSATRTPRPTRTPTPPPTPGPSPTPRPTATPRPTRTPTPANWPTATPRPTRTPTPTATSTPHAIPNAIRCTCSYYSESYSEYSVFVLDRGVSASSTARIYHADGTTGSEYFSEIIKTFSGAIARIEVATIWQDGAWARGSVSCAAEQPLSTPTNTVTPASTSAPKPTDTATPTSTTTLAPTATLPSAPTPAITPTPTRTAAPAITPTPAQPHKPTATGAPPIVAPQGQAAAPISSPTSLPASAPIEVGQPAATATPGKTPGAGDYVPPEAVPSQALSAPTGASAATATETPQPTGRMQPSPNHIGNIRLEQAAGEFTAPEITLDLRNLTIDRQRIKIVDEQGNRIPPLFYIQPRVWQGGDGISPIFEAQSKAESRKHPGVATFRSSDGTGHDSIVQRGDDRIIELHSWRARDPKGRIILEPGELLKLILDGPDLIMNQQGRLYAVASRTAEERQHVITQLIGQAFLLSQPDGKGGTVRQQVQIKWIYTPAPATVSAYYSDSAMTVRQMIETDPGIIPKQQPGEQWLQFCTLRTADQPRETYGRGGAGRKPRLIDHEQTLTSISIIPVRFS